MSLGDQLLQRTRVSRARSFGNSGYPYLNHSVDRRSYLIGLLLVSDTAVTAPLNVRCTVIDYSVVRRTAACYP